MKKLITLFILFSSYLVCNDYSVVFIHIGNRIPAYLPIALKQAKLFNPDNPIVLVANKKVLDKFALDADQYELVSIESLKKSNQHVHFLKHHKLNNQFWGGFWRFATERLYYLYDYMKQYDRSHVFHLEYDNMLYADLSESMPIFSECYANCIGATFDNDQRCIAGFIYIPNPLIMQQLVDFINKHLARGFNDMRMLAFFKNQNPQKMKNLPIIPQEYARDYPLVSPAGHKAQNKEPYYQHSDIFASVFDAAALGQYLGGIDPRNGPSKPGFINESCIFNPSYFTYEWIKDKLGRKVPYLIYNQKAYKINNLHIHSKKLMNFTSLN